MARRASPSPIRAEHDGEVLLDANHQGNAVNLQSSWFVVEGIDAKNGLENIYRVGGADNTLRRTIGYDGTAGQPNSYPYDIGGKRNRVEDSAGWGVNCRKIFNSSQAGDVAQGGFTRTWGEWNGHPMSEQEPSNTYQLGYNTTNQRWENILGTWNLRGAHKDPEGALGAFCSGSQSCEMQGSRILGGILYAAPGTNFSATKTVQSVHMRGMYYENILAYIAPEFTSKWPFYFYKCSPEQPCSNNVCKDCLAVHAGAKSINEATSGWTLPGWREGQGLAAATGGRSAFELLPGICYRYANGALTTTPLWPWPMDERITAARAASGYPAVHVTADIEKLLGPIPAQCKGEASPPAGDTTPPQVTLTAPTHAAIVSGTVAVSATATDNVGVATITFYLDKEPVGEEQPGANAYVLADSTTVANGLHKLKARARDTAGTSGLRDDRRDDPQCCTGGARACTPVLCRRHWPGGQPDAPLHASAMSHVLLCQGTARALPLKDASVHTVCTSPPYYGLRRYDCGPWRVGPGGDA